MGSRAIIVGATGLVGRECLALLLPRYDSITAFVRHSTGRLHPRLVERHIDFERLDTVEILPGTHVYCALGTTIDKAGSEDAFRKVDQQYPLLLAQRAASERGTRFMLVSSVGANPRSRYFYLRVKGELEASLQALPFEALHIFRPSLILGDRTETRAGETVGAAVEKVAGYFFLGPLRKYRAVPAATVAQAMVSAAHEDVAGRFLYHYDEIRKLAAKLPRKLPA